MGFILIIILFFVGICFVSFKVNKLKDRAKQQILKGTGFSSSEINATVMNGLEKKKLEKFLADNPNFTEESVKETFKNFANQIINRNPISEFDEKVCEQMQKDSKLEKMQGMQFVRVNISHYDQSKVIAIVFFTDNKDEYNMTISCIKQGDELKVVYYAVQTGATVGF